MSQMFRRFHNESCSKPKNTKATNDFLALVAVSDTETGAGL